MEIRLTTLGVSSASPTTDRYPSAHVLDICGRLFLIDCGEGCQILLKRHRLSMIKLEAVFISHLHGDHYFGLFGLLSSMSLAGRTKPLHIYAPGELAEILEFFHSRIDERGAFEIVFHPTEPECPNDGTGCHSKVVFEDRRIEILSFPLRHRVPTCGYLFRSRTIPLSFAYCSDTAYFPELAETIAGVNLLYHEATFAQEHSELATAMFHSTARQAATTALEAGAGKLVIGHYSSRYKDLTGLLEEARSIFPETYLAAEGAEFSIFAKRIKPTNDAE